ncbi:MAG: DUF2442 domain-containing protein [Bacteroidales bacterium]|nr:DUF2442 domain-containing protein [Bacteroidales bacterium]
MVSNPDYVKDYPSKFRNYVLTDTLEWNDGEIDIAPEYLYENGVVANC